MHAGQLNPSSRRLVDAKETGRVLGCSWRTVLRLADSGKIPSGVKLGALRRWDMAEIESFIASGCKPPKATGKGGRSL
jgi:predicted DNA-binding transcriptional regulator AlpA